MWSETYCVVFDDSHLLKSHKAAIGVVIFDHFAHPVFGVGFGNDFGYLVVDELALSHEAFNLLFLRLHHTR